MKFEVDGGCRRNGQSDAIGAAACLRKRYGRYQYRTRALPYYPTPTNQRAKITAIIMALKWALERYDELDGRPYLKVKIYTDSRYAAGCMNDRIYKCLINGCVNARGIEVANRDLIKYASDLDDRVTELGEVEYIWVPRSENEDADRIYNDELDVQEY